MSIEVMRQALDVLIEINKLSIGEDAVVALPGEIDGAVDNLRAAIEQYDQTALELCNECGWRALIPGEGCLTCARQKAKPVAWVDEGALKWHIPDPQSSVHASLLRGKHPLYTAPRQWVGLTEEETQTLYDRYATYQEYDAWESGWFDFARGIEVWLREKNGA
jgi:hypothetical protein